MRKFDLQAVAAKLAQSKVEMLETCGCVGPQNGEPLCPCAMRKVQVKNGRWVVPERDLGPAPAASSRVAQQKEMDE